MAAEAKRASEYEKEGGKLFAGLLNAVAIASILAATIGQFFPNEEHVSGGLRAALLLIALVSHGAAQFVLWIVFRKRNL